MTKEQDVINETMTSTEELFKWCKTRGILILAAPTDINKSKILQYTGERSFHDLVETRPVIHLDRLNQEEVDALGLIIEPSGQIAVKQPVIFSGTRAIFLSPKPLNIDLTEIHKVCKADSMLLKDKAFEGCRTPEAFRNDKGIYKQHKRQRKHK